MNQLKSFKLETIISSIFYIISGAILLLFPETTAKSICYMIAIVIMAIGVVKVITYFVRGLEQNVYKNDLVIGLICIVIGIVIIYKVRLIISIIPIILGVLVLVSGFRKLQSSIDVKRMKSGNGMYFLVIALINIGLGLILIFNPFEAAKTMFRLVGICLLFSGITDIIGDAYMSKKLKHYFKDMTPFDKENED